MNRTLRSAKTAATRYEFKRVFENFDAPRMITLEYGGYGYRRPLFTWPGGFKWGRWERMDWS